MGKKGLTLGEVIVIVLIVGILAAAMIPAFVQHRRTTRRDLCINYLKQLTLVLEMYSNENKDRFPPIDDTKNNFTFDANLLYPEYLTDHTIAICPADRGRNPETDFRLTSDHSADGTPKGEVHPDCFTGDSYIYLGWMVMRDKEVKAFFDAYDKLSGGDYDANLIVPEGWGALEGNTLHRLSHEVDRILIPDNYVSYGGGRLFAPAIPIMWDRPYVDSTEISDHGAGGNVVYLDGHVDYQVFDRKFPPDWFELYGPINKTMARLLDERPRERIPDCE